MRLFTFTILCFVASAANADTTLFYREYSDYEVNNTIVDGGTLRFTLYADGSEPITIDFVIPSDHDSSAFFEILESDAATYGFDWSELESMVEGPKEQSTDFGPVGHLVHVDGLTPQLELRGGWFEDVTLSRIRYSSSASLSPPPTPNGITPPSCSPAIFSSPTLSRRRPCCCCSPFAVCRCVAIWYTGGREVGECLTNPKIEAYGLYYSPSACSSLDTRSYLARRGSWSSQGLFQ